MKERTMSMTGMTKLLLTLSLARVQGRKAERDKGVWAPWEGGIVCVWGGGVTKWLLLMMGW